MEIYSSVWLVEQAIEIIRFVSVIVVVSCGTRLLRYLHLAWTYGYLLPQNEAMYECMIFICTTLFVGHEWSCICIIETEVLLAIS
jgi:hypothetical protein